MTQITPLDQAFAQMQSTDLDADRLRFYERFADAELFLMLADQPDDDAVTPDIFQVDGSGFVLVFDLEERLAQFAGQTVPYVALSGRNLAGMLAGQGLGVGLNLGSEMSEFLMPADAVTWVTQTLANTPDQVQDRPSELHAPKGLPEVLITALDTKLAITGGRARYAYLCGVSYDGGGKSHLLAFVDAVPGAEQALANAVSEALIFSGVEAGMLDVGFFASHDEMAARLARVGLRFDLPELDNTRAAPAPPGSDPDKPPILR
ncbi:SseB family protein [Parasulfitobacter algicola]|uniref:SseB family protein n=1 Tax=Parasulfitobacter algicola TaxID=2614809 RepID=A0ABX2IQ14_9RHOB|nr:SseB family protein [Sulfitobacter algicola]NSX54101.1 SseB family protein [Sulfitobacter algicola]